MASPAPLRAALIGPGRIGRQHAKWLRASGCQLVGFACADPAHVAPRALELAQTAGCPVPGFGTVEELLETAHPDLVSVCTPAEWHYRHTLACLERRLPVLVEKPLCWAVNPYEALADAKHLAALADSLPGPAGVNLQYTFSASAYEKLVGRVDRPQRVSVILESRGRGAERTPGEVWMELGPHALSVALALVPWTTADLATLKVDTAPRTARVGLSLRGVHGVVAATLEVRQRLEGELVRRFGLDDAVVDYTGRDNADGVYCTYLSRGGLVRESPDWMAESIQRFVDAVSQGERAPITLGTGLANLTVQAAVARRLARTREGHTDG